METLPPTPVPLTLVSEPAAPPPLAASQSLRVQPRPMLPLTLSPFPMAMSRVVPVAIVLASFLLGGCGGADSPDRMLLDIERAFARDDLSLLESRVDLDGVVRTVPEAMRAGIEQAVGSGFLGSLAMGGAQASMQQVQNGLRASVTEAREAGTADVLGMEDEPFSVRSRYIEQRAGETYLHLIVVEENEEMEVQFLLAERDGRWMVTTMHLMRFGSWG